MDDSRGYGSVQRDVMRDKTLPPQAKALYALLASYAGKKNYCFPTVTTLCEDLGLSKPMITKYLAMLQERGIIQKTMHSGGKSNNAHGYEIMTAIKESKPVVTPPAEPVKSESESKAHLTLETQKLSTLNLQNIQQLNGLNLQKLNTLYFSYKGRKLTIEKEHITKEVCEFFAINEQKNYRQVVEVDNFITKLFLNDRGEFFYTQFQEYKNYKKVSGERIHSLINFMGKPENDYEDGGWQSDNYENKLKAIQNKGQPVLSYAGSVDEKIKRQNAVTRDLD